ncbi:MAG: PQQ-binding-like beta-propeller repeat protein [Candidatus Thermoplasmatota archaeon]
MMITRIVSGLVCMLMVGTIVFAGAIEIKKESPTSQSPMNTNQSERYVLIAEEHGLRVTLIDTTGAIIWEKTGIIPTDAEKLENGNVLMTNQYNVIEVDITGTIVWQKMTSSEPFDAERLSNGNTLITEYDRVIEVDPSGTIVWEKTGVYEPVDGERLENGNTMIVEGPGYYGGRVIEVNTAGTIVWQYPVVPELVAFSDAERLANGNTLITEIIVNRVIEVNSAGTIVWEKTGLNYPLDAERLPNGNTLITEYERVIEVNPAGSIVWEKTGLNHALDAEGFFTEPPNTPSIEGSEAGKAGTLYPYTFVANDPEEDSVFYYIDWGDGTNTGWIGPYLSGEEITREHSWSEKGTFSITCKAKDVIYSESDWGTLTVTMPHSYDVPFMQFWMKILGHLSHTFPILRHLLGSTQ